MADPKKISIVVEAIDRATATVKAINGSIARIAAPARAVSRSFGGLVTQSGFNRVGKAVDGIGRSVRTLATTGAVAAGVLGSVGYGLKRISDEGESAVKAAQSFGTTVPEWQKLAHAADMADLSTEDLGLSLGALNKHAIAAATGNQKSALWFRRAGISVRDQSGHVKSSTQLLTELSDVFAKMPDGPKKLALANVLLKDSQGKMIPLLNGGAAGLRKSGDEAVRFGLVSEQAARQEAEFNDQLKRTSAAGRGVGHSIAGAILPAINAMLPKLVDWIAQNRTLIASTAGELVGALGKVAGVIGVVLGAVMWVIDLFGGLSTVVYALAGFLGAKLVFAVLGVAKSFFVLGAAILTTPIGWIMIGIAALATGAYLLIKHWTAVKEFFVDLIETVFSPLVRLMEKLSGLVPKTAGEFGANLNKALIAPPVASAFGPGGGSMGRMGGELGIRIEAPGLSARVTKQESFGGLGLDVESGYAAARGY